MVSQNPQIINIGWQESCWLTEIGLGVVLPESALGCDTGLGREFWEQGELLEQVIYS